MDKIKGIQTGIFRVNTWICPLYKNVVMIIDPDCSLYTGDQDSFISFLKKESLLPLCIVLTHGHFDHIAGIKGLKEAFPFTKILIHKSDEKMIGPEILSMQDDFSMDYDIFDFIKKALTDLPGADGYLEDGKSLDQLPFFDDLKENQDFLKAFSNSEDNKDLEALKASLSLWKILWTPGHTEGSVCLYNEKDGLLFSGDTVFYHSYGRTDLKGGNQAKMMKSLSFLRKSIREDAIVFPGHDYSAFPFGENYLA